MFLRLNVFAELNFLFVGDVVLKNLQLKQSALKELDLPVQTIYGCLGKNFTFILMGNSNIEMQKKNYFRKIGTENTLEKSL